MEEFLKQCKDVVKEKKMPKYLIDAVEISSGQKYFDKKILMKKILKEKIMVRNKCL